MPPTAVGIGERLREAREERALSIEETAWRTRIRPEMLRALEQEDFEALGHAAFVRSHVLSYARFLGLDAEQISDHVESLTVLEVPSPIEELERRRKQAKRPPRPKWAIAGAVSAVVLAVAGVIGALGGQAERPAAKPSLPALDPSPAKEPVAVPAADARVTLIVKAVGVATVSVIADGRQVFEGTIRRGDSRTFRARDDVEIVVSDGAAVRVTHNGKPLGAAGEQGEVARARYGPLGRVKN